MSQLKNVLKHQLGRKFVFNMVLLTVFAGIFCWADGHYLKDNNPVQMRVWGIIFSGYILILTAFTYKTIQFMGGRYTQVGSLFSTWALLQISVLITYDAFVMSHFNLWWKAAVVFFVALSFLYVRFILKARQRILREGATARISGLPIEHNPYREASKAIVWQEGWAEWAAKLIKELKRENTEV